MQAYRCGRAAGEFDSPILTVIDYSLPSSQRRLWVLDLSRQRVLINELVAHGRNSGEDRAMWFSDEPGSKMSSLGLYRTAETYQGEHGLGLRLDGLERGFNENARDRAIVMHGAPYVSRKSIARLGHLGRSWGCPAVSRDALHRIVSRIQGGTALFIYYPDRRWLSQSDYLRCDARTRLAWR